MRRSNPVTKVFIAVIALIVAAVCLLYLVPKQKKLVSACTEKTVGWVDYVYTTGHSGLTTHYNVTIMYFVDEKEYKGSLSTSSKVYRDQQVPLSYDLDDPNTFYIKNLSPSPDTYEAVGALACTVGIVMLIASIIPSKKK